MGTVANTIKLNDQMTPVMRHMLTAMNQTLHVMEELDRSAASADFSKQFGLARHEIDNATKALEEMENAVDQVEDSVDDIRNTQDSVKKGFESWHDTLMGVNAALDIVQKGIQAAKKGAEWVMDKVDAYGAQTGAELQLAIVMGNRGNTMDEYFQILQKASDIQSHTMYGDEAMIAGAGELSTYLKDAQALESALDTLSMYAAGMTMGDFVNQKEMLNFATQLGKAFDGNMSGMTDRGFSLSDEQKKFMETASDMERVALINDMIAESWAEMSEAFRDTTARGQIAAFMNEYGDLKERLGERMEMAVLTLFQSLLEYLPMIESFMTGLAIAANIAMYALSSGIQFVFSLIQEFWPFLLVILGALAVHYIPIIIAGLWNMIAPILAQAAAWALANAPLVMMIFLLGMMLKLMVDAGMTADDVIGFIGGLFGGLYAFIYNIVAEIYNLFVTFAEFFANFLNDPVGSIMRLFSGLADFVLGILQNIASAIDAIFGSNLADAVSGWRSGLADAVGAKYGKAEIQFERMGQMAVLEGVNQGKETASKLADKLAGLTEAFDREGFLNQQFGGAGGAGIDEVGHVGSVGRIDEDVTISDEDIKLMMDLASRDFQLRYTQMTPNFNAGGVTINQKSDVDDMYDAFVQRGIEELHSSLVYQGGIE